MTVSDRRPPRRPVRGQLTGHATPSQPDGLPELRHAAGLRPGGAR